MSFNWRSGNLAVSIESNNGNINHDFLTVQNIDFSFDDNIEVMDSLNQQRLGYFYAPRRIRITMGVIPSKYNDDTSVAISDSDILQTLQYYLIDGDYYNGFFTLTVDDSHQGHSYTFEDCIVMEGGPHNIIMDARPVSQWTILALTAGMTPDGQTSEVIYDNIGAADTLTDVAAQETGS